MKPKCLKGAIINIQVCKKSWKEKSIGCKMSLIGGKTTKKRFIEQWTSKWCGKVGDALHLTIKANLPLVTMMYHMPFYGFAPPICKYNMWNAKAQQDGQDASQMALIKPTWVYKGFITFSPIDWSTWNHIQTIVKMFWSPTFMCQQNKVPIKWQYNFINVGSKAHLWVNMIVLAW